MRQTSPGTVAKASTSSSNSSKSPFNHLDENAGIEVHHFARRFWQGNDARHFMLLSGLMKTLLACCLPQIAFLCLSTFADTNFNRDWKFSKGAQTGAEAV